jgi:hypothetical protein
MQPEYISEYELIRHEMITVKECITRYIGYVLGGSGLAIYGIVAFGQSKLTLVSIAIICLALSVIMSFVLLILFYKFFSHNRFAGYCKLLNHEFYGPICVDNSQCLSPMFSWETAIERLRASDSDPRDLLNTIEHMEIQSAYGTDVAKKTIKEDLKYILPYYTGKKPVKDNSKFKRGLLILLHGLIGKIETRSWAFPPIVVSMFFIIIFAFLGGGLFSLYEWHITNHMNIGVIHIHLYVIYIFAALVTLSQIVLWYRLCGKLYTLMKGSSTIDGFFWRFIPVRASFLNELKITPQYLYVEQLLKKEVDTLTQEFGGESDSESN